MRCKKQIFFFAVCFYYFSSNTFAQQKGLDSLLKLNANYKTEDTVKLDLMNSIAWQFYISNPDKGLEIANSAIALAQKLKDKRRLARAYDNIGINYIGKNDYIKILKYRTTALQIYSELGDKERMQHVLGGLAYAYYGNADYPKAVEEFQKSLHINEQLNNAKGMAEDFAGLGLVYNSIADYPKALEFHQKALNIWEQLYDKSGIGYNLDCIWRIYINLSDYSNSLDFFKRALNILEQTDDTTEIISALDGLAETYYKLSNYGISFIYYQKVLALSRQLDYKNGMAASLNGLGKILPLLSNKTHIDNGEIPASRYDKALEYENQSLQIGIENHALNFQSSAWENVSKIYEKEKDYPNAFKAYKNFIMLRDSMVNDEKKKQIERLEFQYVFDKKTDSVKLEERLKDDKAKQQQALNKLKLQQQWFYSISILTLLGLASSWFIYRNRLKGEKLKIELAKEKAEQEKKEAAFQRSLADVSLTALRSQMNPHFIFNCLNSIKLYTTQNDNVAASEYLTKFSKLIRLVMENSRNDKISLASELNALQLYIEMDVMRFKEKLQYNIHIEKDVEIDYIEIPPLLLQPYVENAIWHGLMPKEEGGKIEVNVSVSDDRSCLQISIVDNGIGRVKSAELQSKTATKHKSYGMKVTSERIALINQIYKTGADVTVYNLMNENEKPSGTKVIIQIPV